MHTLLFTTLSQYQTIILVGGGTGGHIQPIISLIENLKTETGKLKTDFLWIGGRNSNEEQEAQKNNIPFESISTLKLTTTRSPKVLLYPFVLIQGILNARNIIRSVIARNEAIQIANTGSLHTSRGRTQICVFSKGGPGSVAIGIAAWTLNIPLYIHESDTIPGRSNRILGLFAKKIFLGFESAKKYFREDKCEVVGQILHPVFSSHCEPAKQSRKVKTQQLLDRFVPRDDIHGIRWKTDKPHFLVICGSQGAKSIFETIIEQFSGNNDYEWIISLGKLNEGMKKDFEKMTDTQALEWISQEDIAHLIQNADLAITRGSATTLAELTAFQDLKTRKLENSKTRLIIIPLPHSADNHQYYNAKEYEKMGHILLEQKNIDQLKEIITKI